MVYEKMVRCPLIFDEAFFFKRWGSGFVFVSGCGWGGGRG